MISHKMVHAELSSMSGAGVFSAAVESRVNRGLWGMDVLRPFIGSICARSREAVAMLLSRKASAAGIMGPLWEMEERLRSLTRTTEDEFLAIGESLQSFHRRAGEISEMASAVGSLLSNDQIRGAIEELRSVFERMERVKGESERNIRTLLQILETLYQLRNHLEGFTRIVRMLNVLCNSTRIENARLGSQDEGFDGLADDVKKLASLIDTKCGELLERSVSLESAIHQTLSHLSAIKSMQLSQASIVQESTMGSLESLTERYNQSSVCAENISRGYGAIVASMGEIVTSMQFHDITRQRIEHVAQAVNSLLSQHSPEMDGAASNGNGWRSLFADRPKVPAITSEVCTLQAAQLQRANDELAFAVNKIGGNLSAISASILDISEETRGMAGFDGKTDRSFFTQIEEGVASAAAALSQYGDASKEMRSAIASVGSTLGDMSAFAGDMEGIGARMKLIALNAIVKASHLGDLGAALSVLSENIHLLSIETCRLTTSVCETLRSIIGSADDLSFNARVRESAPDGGIRQTEETLGRLSVTFRKANESVVSLLGRIDEAGRGLSGDIGQTVSGITVHEKVDAVIKVVLSGLHKAAALSAASKPDSPANETSRYVKSLETSYTMEAERKIHDSLLKTDATKGIPLLIGGTLPPDGPPDKPNPSDRSDPEVKDEDLGDNVELF